MNIQPIQRDGKDYAIFPIERILDNSTTDFDLYIQLKDHFILYGGNGYKWEKSELERLVRLGVQGLLISTADLPKAQMYGTLNQLPEIDKNLAPPERIRSIEDVGATFIKLLHEGEITPACVHKAESVARVMVDCVAEDPACIKELSGLADHDHYTYYHSIRVSCYAVALAVQMGLSNEKQLRDIALGGIFHDVGKKFVPLDVINKAGPLTETEWGLMRDHPKRGYHNIRETLLSLVPQEIVLHHHEKLDGSGYPDAIGKDSLLMEVQIATVADVFDALTSSRAYQNKRSRYEGLDFIKHKMLGAKISPEVFKALVGCLV